MSRIRIAFMASSVALAALALGGCATTERSHSVVAVTVAAAATPYQGPRVPVSVGKFENRSSFMRGIFS
ncbi:MAG TPA: curli production assembly protein CsgG, partial [Burkholderiaceae bacterium]|nr:curli production assembly protein CsgG [Burkholderiaceae bacterium]